jgi:hypothetical protein
MGGVGLLAAVGLALMRQRLPAFRSYAEQSEPIRLVPALTGKPEYCLTCHFGIEEISPSHPVETFGCVRCHGGIALALEAEAAHQGLIGGRNPSDLSVVEQGCGGKDCHSGASESNRDHIARSLTSLQATYAGAIAQVRYAFGAQPDLQARYATRAIADASVMSESGVPALEDFALVSEDSGPFVAAFAGRCLSCHLWSEPPSSPGYQRLTGCAACHSPSNLAGSYAGDDPTVARGESGHAERHRLTTAIPYSQCNSCHNRGNYSLETMTFQERGDLPDDRRAPRLRDYYQPIAQFTLCEWELDCIDCHTSLEAMGDGDLHSRKQDVQYVQCRTCHGTLTELPETLTVTSAEDLALRRAFLNQVANPEVGDTIVATDRGEAMWNVDRQVDGGFDLVGKASEVRYDVPFVMGSLCEQQPDQQGSRYCHACHAIERP